MDRLIGSRLAVRVHRLKHPVYRNKALQVVADAALVGFAYYLAFRLRFLESAGGLPEPYSDMLWGSIGFVVVGTVAALAAFRLYEKWWRYFRLPDFVALVKATSISALVLLIALYLLRPFDEAIPRSVLVTYFLLSTFMLGGARLLVRMLVERPTRMLLGI